MLMQTEPPARERPPVSRLAADRPRAAALAPADVGPDRIARALDVLLSVLLLLAAWPFLLLGVVLVRATSRGPVFYAQTRLGRPGKPFQMYKIRTMYHDSEGASGPA